MPSPLQQAGRWSEIHRSVKADDADGGSADLTEEHSAFCARLLLQRYGVVMRPLLERESNMPGWRELLLALRRMEARGEIRGGRFVDGVAGEQYALPEVVPLLRSIRKQDRDDQLLMISATDPLNLLGTLHPGERLPALHTNRLLILNGQYVAVRQGSDIRFLETLDAVQQRQARDLLIRDRVVQAADNAAVTGRQP